MITRSKRDASYEYFELPDKRKKRQKKEENVEKQVENVEQQEKESYEPNIRISYYERPPLYEVNIDFDEAHNEWVKNKIRLKNGCYRYKKERKGNIKKVKVVSK